MVPTAVSEPGNARLLRGKISLAGSRFGMAVGRLDPPVPVSRCGGPSRSVSIKVRRFSSWIWPSPAGSVRTCPVDRPTLCLYHLHGLVLTCNIGV